jgi:hypothetical protein
MREPWLWDWDGSHNHQIEWGDKMEVVPNIHEMECPDNYENTPCGHVVRWGKNN